MPRVSLSLREARKILLVQELDRSDPGGELMSAEEKCSASIRCADFWDPGSKDEKIQLDPPSLRFLRRRSADILHLLAKQHPDLMEEAQWRHQSLRWVPLFLIAAALTGFLLASLGPSREFNLMALPVLLILAWNFVVVILAVASWFRPGRQPGQGGPIGLQIWSAALCGRIAPPTVKTTAESNSIESVKQRLLSGFRDRERELLRPWQRARVSVFLHAAAAMLALAGVLGLYHRGWAVEYRAVWESTLLGVDGARQFFGGLFQPAATIFNLPLPLEQLPAMQTGPGREAQPVAALPWIHLYATTLLLFAVLPRVLLALAEVLRARRALRRAVLPPDILDHLRNLARDLSGLPSVLVVLPYGYDPVPRVRDEVRALLHEVQGGRVCIQYRGPVCYGDEEPCIYFKGEEASASVILMNMASTPEDETHGFLVRGLRERRLVAQAGGALLVLVDAGPFVERLHDLPEFERRLQQRSQVWRETIERVGLQPVFLNLPNQTRQEVVAAMRECWWQAPLPTTPASSNPRQPTES